MSKRAVVNGFFGLLLAASSGMGAEGTSRGDGSGVSVKPTTKNYYIATLLGEADHYAPTFYDDYIVSAEGRPVVQFTKVQGKPLDWYWHVVQPQDVAWAEKLLKADKGAESAAPGVLDALARYRAAVPVYEADDLYSKALTVIHDITAVAPQKVVGDGNSKEIDAALYRYLRSNGISRLEQLREKPALINMLVNKFYMLSTTYFYRDYPYVKEFLNHLEPIQSRLARERRPFKAKIFACSTGEEVLTYAIELVEAGVRDFTILASDINDSALRHAEGMRYSDAALARLSSSAQQKIARYFRLNEKLGVWEPKDPEFFKARIKYIHQDILKDLPSDLPSQFAPPYDLVSAMNVLFYLDDAAVQARKDHWARLVAPDGILVLHDFHYSLMLGTLGHEWAFNNFLSANEWVSIKADRFMSGEQKVRFYEAGYKRSRTDGTFLSLVQAHLLTGRREKAVKLCEDHLEAFPRSAVALNVLWELSVQARDEATATSSLARLIFIQPHSPETLAKLAEAEKDRKEKDFLRALIRAQRAVMAGRKTRAERLEELFEFKEPASAKYDLLRRVLKLYALGLAENRAFSSKETARGERLGLAALALAKELLKTPGADRHITVPFVMDQLATDLLEHYLDEKMPERALALADEMLASVADAFKDAPSVHAAALAAHLRLQRATALKSLGRLAEARGEIDEAVKRFDAALPLVGEMAASRRPFFLGDAGRAHMVRGELAAAKEKSLAERENEKALALLDEGLSFNPLYGKSLSDWREELLRRRTASREAARSESAPLEGYVLRFRDAYGPHSFTREVVRLKAEDGTTVEATQLTPDGNVSSSRPGLVFIHMWARDRNTWWGLPEFMASHGYASIYMDMRGHGGTAFKDTAKKVTIDDTALRPRYVEFVRDVYPALDRLAASPAANGKVIVLGASLGCPIGVIAAERRREVVEGLVMLSPSQNFFGVDCSVQLRQLGAMPLFVMAEKTDNSFSGAQEFFRTAKGYKTYFEVDRLGHGTDALYRDAGLPTVLYTWVRHLSDSLPSFRVLKSQHIQGKK